jgi:putative SbcD/Mre11-related phosphoesterase
LLTFVESYPALLLQHNTQRTLIIADLHLGWEVALAEKGIHVPSQMPKLLQRLITVIGQTKPHMLLLLGDIKHTIAKTATEEWRDIPDFFEALTKKVADIRIILGNHDGNLEPLLPETVHTQSSTGAAIGNVGFLHGHTWPSLELLKCQVLVMGHVHPVVMFEDRLGYRITRQVWVKVKVDAMQLKKSLIRHYNVTQAIKEAAKVNECIIMPSFNDFLGGRSINRKSKGGSARYQALSPLLRSKSTRIEEAELFLLDGTFLGTVDQLTKLS